jgi:ferrous-iron efflux pump FieF
LASKSGLGLADSILDLCASLITLIAVKFALEPADKEHRFGHGKLEALAGLAQALIIFGSAIYVGVEAAIRMLTPAPVTEPAIGVAVMGASLVITAALVLLQRYVVRRTGSIAIRADSIHYQADFMTNIAVIAAIGLSAGLGWHAADPLLGIAVVIFILISIRQIVQQSMDVLLDRELPTETRERILEPRAMRRSATYTTCAPGPQVLLTLFNFTWNSTQRSHYKRRIRSVLRSNWL